MSLSILLTNPIAVDSVRSALEGREELWFICLLIASGGVAIGCVLEIPETWTDLKEWRKLRKESAQAPGWRVPMAATGLLLVVLGVIGEGVFEALVSINETALRAHDEQALADTVKQAGTAKESAEKAQRAAEFASRASGEAMGKATEAYGKANAVFSTATKASDSAKGALALAGDAKAQVATVQSNIAKIDEKYAPRKLSKIEREILIDYLRRAPKKPKEPIVIQFDLTAFDGEGYGQEIASAINDASTGWKAKPPVAVTGDGEKIGIFLGVRDTAFPPPEALFLAQALKNAGLGVQGIGNPRLQPGSLQIDILICRKN